MTDLSSDIDTSLSPWSDIYHAGFYPELVISALYDQLDSREILASLVHVETHVDYNDLHRHLVENDVFSVIISETVRDKGENAITKFLSIIDLLQKDTLWSWILKAERLKRTFICLRLPKLFLS